MFLKSFKLIHMFQWYSRNLTILKKLYFQNQIKSPFLNVKKYIQSLHLLWLLFVWLHQIGSCTWVMKANKLLNMMKFYYCLYEWKPTSCWCLIMLKWLNFHSQVDSKGLFHTTTTTIDTYRVIVSRVFVGC